MQSAIRAVTILWIFFNNQTRNMSGEYFQPCCGFCFGMQLSCVYVRKHKSFVTMDIGYHVNKNHG